MIEDEVVQYLYVHLLVAHHVGRDEFAATFVIESLHRGIFNSWEFPNHGLHLLQLDAETPNLHLTVATADELDVAVGQVTHDVARTIDRSPFRFVRERIGDKDLRLFIRTVQVASGHLRTAEPQLAKGTCGKPLAVRICDVCTYILQRFSDGNVGVFLIHLKGRHNDGGLRRTITVVQLVALRGRERRQLLACH